MLANLRFLLKYLVIMAVCVAAAFLLARTLNPLAGLDARIGPDEAKRRGAAFADSLGVQTGGMSASVTAEYDADLLKETYRLKGLAEGSRLLADQVPGYFWDLSWKTEGQEDLVIRRRDSESERAAREISMLMRRPLKIRLDMKGNLLEFSRVFGDSVEMPSMSPDSARQLAEETVRRLVRIITPAAREAMAMTKSAMVRRPFRADHEFEWTGRDTLLGNTIRLNVAVAGNSISSLSVNFEIPSILLSKSDPGPMYREIGIVLLYVVLIIVMIVMAFKRSRVYEMGFRMGIILGVFAAVAFAIEMYTNFPPGIDFRLIISMVVGTVFVGLGVALSWSVAESLGREVWKEKFATLDLTTKGYFFHSLVGKSVVRGFAIGTVYHLAWLSLIGAAALVVSLWFDPRGDTIRNYLTRFSPGFAHLVHTLYTELLALSVLVVFSLSLFRRWFTGTVPILLLGGLVLGVASTTMVRPVIPAMIIDILAMLVIVWVFMKYDAIAAYVAMVTGSMFQGLFVLLRMSEPSIVASGTMVLGLGGLLLVLACVAVLTKDRLVDLDAITPAFTRNITERERLQQELQIARDVQMSLLPKKIPSFAGLDIASRCVPALEVGGDYYDFITFSDTRIGIVVGDVSGKGTEGAFYMTLTKGFLKAVTRAMQSPAEILAEANTLFYENVDRGNFITVLYAVFDTAEKVVTIARAGHNPALLKRASSPRGEFLQPSGIALGLEPGEVFGKAIEEVNVPFSTGDLFVLTTDGFSEAMTPKGEEYGEERLMEVVQENSARPAAEILEAVLRSVRSFAGRAKQHDDMTIVVVKCV